MSRGFEASLDISDVSVRLKDWSAQDFSMLYTRFRPTLVAYGMRIHPRLEDVEECVQDTFLYLMTALPELDSEVGVQRYLKWKLKMLLIDRSRLSSSRNQSLMAVEELASPEDVSLTIERAEDVAVVKLALARLPQRQRDALIATHLMEEPIAQSSARLGLTQNAFRQLLHRSRGAFRTALTAEVESAGGTISELLTKAGSRASKVVGASLLILGIAFAGSQGFVKSLQDNQLAVSDIRLSGLNQADVGGASRIQDVDSLTPYTAQDRPLAVDVRASEQFAESMTLTSRITEEEQAAQRPAAPVLRATSAQDEVRKIATVVLSAAAMTEGTETHLVKVTPEVVAASAGEGVTAFLGLAWDTENVIQYVRLEIQTESGDLVGVPKVKLESTHQENGILKKFEFVATDFLFGDLHGGYDYVAADMSVFSRLTVKVSGVVDSNLEIKDLQLSIQDLANGF